ncbi:unnamed protein product [Rangifer tarandus platyrhynchus]|uniref:Uncharacterized protein n=1 Tax=Rangifer tarandus platyrhynchus TaxID=3082113 RepID=A0AC60A8R9_RANTA
MRPPGGATAPAGTRRAEASLLAGTAVQLSALGHPPVSLRTRYMLQGPRLVHAKLDIPDLKYSSPCDHQAAWASAFSSNRKAPTLLLEPA